MQTFKTSKAKENILGKVRKALGNEQLPMPFPEAEKEMNEAVFVRPELSAEEAFADSFIKLGGKFIFCDHEQELLEQLVHLYESRGWQQMLCAEPRLLQLLQNNKINIAQPADSLPDKAEACITGCELLVGRTGSVILSSKQYLGRTATVFYPVHIIIAYTQQVVADIGEGLEAMTKKYGNALPSMINLNTGPSRTADIEKTLVVGVHGPGEVFCFLVNA